MGPVAQLMRCVVPAAVALLLIVVAPASGAVVAGPLPGLSAATGIAYVYDASSTTTTPGANVAFASVGTARSWTWLAVAPGGRQGRLLAAEEGGPSLLSRIGSRLRDETGSWSPFRGRTSSNFDWIAQRLEQYHGIDPKLASARLHAIKAEAGLGPADNVLFDRTGNVYESVSGEYLGSLTQGGG